MQKAMTLVGLGGAAFLLLAFGQARAQQPAAEVNAVDATPPAAAATKPPPPPEVVEQVPDAE